MWGLFRVVRGDKREFGENWRCDCVEDPFDGGKEVYNSLKPGGEVDLEGAKNFELG